VEENKTKTKGGNTRPPAPSVYLPWVQKAFEAVTKEQIIDSFKSCGITIASDGSEDNSIFCLKNTIPQGRAALNEMNVEHPLSIAFRYRHAEVRP
jgi:hypothetical protein